MLTHILGLVNQEDSKAKMERSVSSLPGDNSFKLWEEAIDADERGSLEESRMIFVKAGQEFFNVGTNLKSRVGRAYFEYSTLMDSFSKVQSGRLAATKSNYEDSIKDLSASSNILRSTIHFGFLSAYVSACATLEVGMKLEDASEEFEALKNSIALFEQAKLSLGLRDERHPLIRIIDCMIKYCISRAFLAESKILSSEGRAVDAEMKIDQSSLIEREYLGLARTTGLERGKINYLPLDDWKRVQSCGFLVTFPEKTSIWLGNIGLNPVEVETLGEVKVGLPVYPASSISVEGSKLPKGQIRVKYRDLVLEKSFDEGCVLSI